MAEADFADIIRGQGDFIQGLQGATRNLAGFTAGIEVAFRVAGSVVNSFSQALGALGPEAKVVQAAFAVAAAEVVAFTGIIAETTNALNTFRAAMQQSGGTPGDIARLAAFGIGPGQAAGASAAFTQRTSMAGGNFFAQSELMKLGVRPGMGEPIDSLTGNTNQAERLASTLDKLNQNYERDRTAAGSDPRAQQQVFNQLLGKMRLLGLEGSIGAVTMPRAVVEKQLQTADLQKEIMDPEAQANAAALNAEIGRLGQSFQLLITALGKPFLEDFTKGIGKLADVVGWAAREVNKHPKVWRFLIDAMFPVIGAIDMFMTILGNFGDVFKVIGDAVMRFVDIAGLVFHMLVNQAQEAIGTITGDNTGAAAAAAEFDANLKKAQKTMNAPFGGAAKGAPGAPGSGTPGDPLKPGDPWYHQDAKRGGMPGASDPLSDLLNRGTAKGGAKLPWDGPAGKTAGKDVNAWEDAFKGMMMAMFPGLDLGGDGKPGKKSGASGPILTPAQKEDIDATNRLIQALDEVVTALKQGLFGGGPRTSGAIPPRGFNPLKGTDEDRKNAGWHMDRSAASRMFRYGGTTID